MKIKLRQRLFNEFTEYLINFVYMSVIFSAVILYRRLILAQYGIILEDYFAGVIKAFVIAKVVMIGAFLRVSRKFEHKPLFIPVLYKAVLFTLWVMIFDILEVFIVSFIRYPDWAEGFNAVQNRLSLVWAGGAMLIFFIFIPFFAFKELNRVMGKKKVLDLFIRKPVQTNE